MFSNLFLVLLLLLAGSLVPKFQFQVTKKLERGPGNVWTEQFGKWRDSFSSALAQQTLFEPTYIFL